VQIRTPPIVDIAQCRHWLAADLGGVPSVASGEAASRALHNTYLARWLPRLPRKPMAQAFLASATALFTCGFFIARARARCSFREIDILLNPPFPG
jgi:hypothetical protein